MSPRVEIYTTGWCGFCSRAKALLTRKGVVFEEYRVDEQRGLREQMQQRSHGGRTVPQIFIDDRHIGGCDDLHALDRSGGLDRLLGTGAARVEDAHITTHPGTLKPTTRNSQT
jgi:glutaredoxin 3